MAVVLEEGFGLKPSMTLIGGSPTTLPQGSVPFLPAYSGAIAMTRGGLRTVSFVDLYRSQPWVAGPIRRMCEAIACVPQHLYRYLDAAGDTRERDRLHDAARLLRRPRPGQRGFHLRWDISLGLYVQGNWVGWKRRPRAGAPPYELWSLDWRLLVPVMAGGSTGRVIGWRWHGDGVPGLERGDVILIEDTVHIAFNGPGGGELGVSPLEQLQTTLRSEDALQRLAEANARNGTRFGVAVIMDPKVKTDAIIRAGVREELIDAHGGVDQAYQPAILGGGVQDLKPLGGQTAVEAELINQRKVNREETTAVIGLPQPLAGILDETNYAGIKELVRLFHTTTLRGPLDLIAESLVAQLLDAEAAWDDDDRFFEPNLDGVLRGDPKERWETYAIALDHGGLTLNDVRKAENKKPYDDPRADEPLIAANNVRPLSAVGQDGSTGSAGVTQAGAAGDAVGVIVRAHAARAVDRAAAGAIVGLDTVEALDGDRARRELAADLETFGLNGSSAQVADVVIADLERRVASAESAEDVYRSTLEEVIPE